MTLDTHDTSPQRGTPRSRLRKWLHEPLLHFLLIGGVIFAGYEWMSPQAKADAQPKNRIVLTSDDLIQMALTWRAQGRPMPNEKEMASLIETKVREEVLYREALALGLDKDDTIIKRRLAQKMDFVAEDVSSMLEPTPALLKDWFDKNSQRFALPPRLTFTHRYFSPDRRQAAARPDAERALARLARADASDNTVQADAFMFQDRYVDQSSEQVAAAFGPQFAQALLTLKPGAWQGPVESGYGWHVVFVEEVTPGRIPAYEEIEPDVKQEWLAQQRIDAKRTMYEAMRARYEVVVSDTRPQAGSASAPTGNASAGAATTAPVASRP